MASKTLIKVPRFSGKTTLEELTGLETKNHVQGASLSKKPCLYRQDRDGVRHDYLWYPKQRATKLFVLFSGDAMRWKNDPPVFQRWKWAPYFPGHCLFVSDPSLFLHEKLGLAWYAGTSEYDPLPAIAEMIKEVAEHTEVPADGIWSYGSSGGGFAALRLLTVLPDAGAICINPQTNIARYDNGGADFYLRVGFGLKRNEAGTVLGERINMCAMPELLRRRRIIYIQNVMDTHHYEEHYRPFCVSQGVVPLDPDGVTGKHLRIGDAGAMRTVLFANETGHGGAETPEAFTQAMQGVSEIGWRRKKKDDQ